MTDVNECLVRPMNTDDLDRVRTWRNHPDISRHMLTRHSITPAEHRQWFERASQDEHKHLLIVEDGISALGFVQFSEAIPDGIADWGFYRAPEAPRGAGRKLGISALNHAFNKLGLHKVCGQALATNKSSIRFHLAMGFQQEGLLRDQHRISDVYHDLVCFGLLRHEWVASDLYIEDPSAE